MDIPSNSPALINMLKEKYEDKLNVDVDEVGTPTYWKKAGVVELLRELDYFLNKGGK